jgi:hypothetical protein
VNEDAIACTGLHSQRKKKLIIMASEAKQISEPFESAF